MAFGSFLGNPAVAGALSLGAGLARGYAQERQTQADHRRRMAELRYRQQLGAQDYEMRQAINARHPSAAGAARLAEAKGGYEALQGEVADIKEGGSARTESGQPIEFNMGPVEEAPIRFTDLIQAIDNDWVNPEEVWKYRDEFFGEEDWGNVESAVKAARKRRDNPKGRGAKRATAYRPVTEFLPKAAQASPGQSGQFPGADGGHRQWLESDPLRGGMGAGGDPSTGGMGAGGDPSTGGMGINVTLPDGTTIPQSRVNDALDLLDQMTPEQIAGLRR